MNLVKNGAVMLVALSAFALTSLTSCKKEMTYKEALAWIEKHYKEPLSEPMKVDKSTVIWDYTRNKPNDTTVPESIFNPALEGQADLNRVSSLVVYGIFKVENLSKTDEPTGTADVPNSSRAWDCASVFTKEEFADVYHDAAAEKVKLKQKFSVKGNTMTVTETYRSKQEFGDDNEDAPVYVEFDETDIRVIGEDGLTKSLTMKMSDKNVDIVSTVSAEDDHNYMGKFDLRVEMKDFHLTPEGHL